MSNSAVKGHDGTICPRHHVKSTCIAEDSTPKFTTILIQPCVLLVVAEGM